MNFQILEQGGLFVFDFKNRWILKSLQLIFNKKILVDALLKAPKQKLHKIPLM